MSDRRSFWFGLFSAVLLTVIALYGLMLELWIAESFAAYWFREQAHYVFGQPLASIWMSQGLSQLGGILRLWAAAATPGIILYPFCWYTIIWESRDYSVRRTWFLTGAGYVMCSIVSITLIAVLMIDYAIFTGHGAPVIPSAVSGMSLPVVALAGLGTLASYAVMLACFVSMPFFPLAIPLAFLHRALLVAFVGDLAVAAKKTPQRRTFP